MQQLLQTGLVFLAIAVALTAAGTPAIVSRFSFTSGPPTEQMSALVDVGTTVKMRCEVNYNATGNPPRPLVHLERTFEDKTKQVATNDDYDEPYFSNPKYKKAVLPMPVGTNAYEWTFEDVAVGNSANYTCQVTTSPTDRSSVTISLNVTAEPTQLSLYIDNELQPQSPASVITKKNLVIGQKYSLKCIAIGANPFPTVQLKTDRNATLPIISTETTTQRQDTPFPGTVNRSTTITADWTMDQSQIGRQIICTAGVKNLNALSNRFIPVADNVLPQFRCDDVFKYDGKAETFDVKCEVFGEALTSYYVSWNAAGANASCQGKKDVTVTSIEDSRYSLLVKGPQASSIWWTMTLTISRAYEINDLSQNKYKFVAVGSKGPALHIVTVDAPGSSGNSTSGINGSPYSSVSSYLIVLLITALTVLFG